MKKTYLEKGFTLIELLVVIAIIGILSSVVLASLNSARSKGTDAAIKSNLANMRAQGEVYYDTNGRYATTAVGVAATASAAACSTATTVFAAAAVPSLNPGILAAESASDSTATWVATCAMAGDASSWAVSVPLKGGGTWCVDSSGASRATAATGGHATAATAAVCS